MVGLLMHAGPIGAADAGALIDLSTPWNLVQTYVVNEVLLSNNPVNSEGTLTPLIYSFLGILLTFLITCGITRFIRHRSGEEPESSGPVKDIVVNGVHVHHQVFWIILMTVTGLVLVAFSLSGSALAVMATVLGVGIGLAFDEFALWLYLDDVYWETKVSSRSMRWWAAPRPPCERGRPARPGWAQISSGAAVGGGVHRRQIGRSQCDARGGR